MDAAKAGAEQLAAPRQMVVVDGDSCPPQPCMSSAKETEGDHAAHVTYQANPTPPGGNGPGPFGCYVYVNQDANGWHFYNGACTQNGMLPQLGDGNLVTTPGTCGNVREQPNTKARIIKCVPDRTQLSVDGGPTWNDTHLWWHIKGSGWIAHDNLMFDFHPGAQQ